MKPKQKSYLELGDTPDHVLRSFIDQVLPREERWRTIFRERIRNCLEGKRQPEFLRSLFLNARPGVAVERLRVVTAALVHELEHRKERPIKRRGDNRGSALQTAISFIDHPAPLGKVARNYLTHVPLEELAEFAFPMVT